MKTKNPLISVVIPVYNCEKYFSEALNSALSQNYRPIEIIVVDDGSTDNSAKIAKSYKEKVKYTYQNNSGPAAARNTGIQIATGEFIAFLDADDLWPQNKLTLQLSNFKNDLELEISMGRIKYVEIDEVRKKRSVPLLDTKDSFKYVNLGAGLFKKTVFNKVGAFDEKFIFCEDLDWFLRAYEQEVSIILLDKITMFYRIHSENMTNNKKKKISDYTTRAISNSFRRRKDKSCGKVKPILDFFELSKTTKI